jgi:hypothetical protein
MYAHILNVYIHRNEYGIICMQIIAYDYLVPHREDEAMKALLLLRSPGYGFLTGNIIRVKMGPSEELSDQYISSTMTPDQV